MNLKIFKLIKKMLTFAPMRMNKFKYSVLFFTWSVMFLHSFDCCSHTYTKYSEKHFQQVHACETKLNHGDLLHKVMMHLFGCQLKNHELEDFSISKLLPKNYAVENFSTYIISLPYIQIKNTTEKYNLIGSYSKQDYIRYIHFRGPPVS